MSHDGSCSNAGGSNAEQVSVSQGISGGAVLPEVHIAGGLLRQTTCDYKINYQEIQA